MSTLSPSSAATTTARRPDLMAGLRGLVRGREDEAAWVRPAFAGVVALAAILYLWNLTVSGYANTYYAMAAQAASQSWSAWFWGSLDAAHFITVDKPPLATMLLGLSVRLFGLSSWSILLPQAMLGVATVALVFVAVKRSFGPAAATIAGVVAALTPAAVLIFRYDNPDALLTFLFVAAAWAVQRAIEDGRTRWLVAAGICIGLAFNTKFLQAYLVVPALGFAYLVAGAPGWRRRFVQLIAFGAVTFLASSWWVAAVELTPADMRPYIGGSETNSAVELLLGYDGLGRIFGLSGPGGGASGGPRGVGGFGGGFGGDPGVLRMFNDQFAGQVGWLLPLAFAGLGVGLWARRRERRSDLVRGAYLLWGGWLLVHVVVFSFMSEIIHPYYTVAMAPAIGALVGGGLVELWRLRSRSALGGVAFAIAIIGTAALGAAILARTPEFLPGLGTVGLIAGRRHRRAAGDPGSAARPAPVRGARRCGDRRDARRAGRVRHRHDEHGLLGRRPGGRSAGGRRVLAQGPGGGMRPMPAPAVAAPCRTKWRRDDPAAAGRFLAAAGRSWRRPCRRPRRRRRARRRGPGPARLPRREPRFLDMVGGRQRIEPSRSHPACVWPSGHGDGRLQRRRSGPHDG